jgi:hypothetical protein
MNGNSGKSTRNIWQSVLREIERTYENCKNSLIWQQGKKDTTALTHGEHIENKLGTYGEVCV